MHCNNGMMAVDLSVLERKSALYILLTVRDNPGLTKTQLMRLEEGNERTKFVRINELIECGLIDSKQGDGQWNSTKLYLTPQGQEIAESIYKISKVLETIDAGHKDVGTEDGNKTSD